jgi:hypothetical protein
MKLLYHYHVSVLKNKDGGLFVPGFQGKFIDILASKCEELYLAMHEPVPEDRLFE